MHYFTNRFKQFFDLRENRAQLRHARLNLRLHDVLARDVLEGFCSVRRKVVSSNV